MSGLISPFVTYSNAPPKIFLSLKFIILVIMMIDKVRKTKIAK